MNDQPKRLFDSAELANHIADTLIDHRLVAEKDRENAMASIKWELDAQCALGRIELRVAG